jgi:uncharacterized repeat protein (TIGR01451 family)
MTVAGLALMAVSIPASSAFANAPNPLNTTTGTATVNSNGSVTIDLKGTWEWPVNGAQSCQGRYGEGWSVDWWGSSTSPTPNPNFTLTNATQITDSAQDSSTGTEARGVLSAVGGIEYAPTGTYFHVSDVYDGQNVNTASTCTDITVGGKTTSTGPWSAAATYPSVSDVPAQLCLILYDEHGSEGQPTTASGSPLGHDFVPLQDDDNSIQTNAFNPVAGAGYCFSSGFAPALSVLKTGPATGSVGGTGQYTLTVTNTGNAPANNATVTDTLPDGETFVSSDPTGACVPGGTAVSGTSPGASQTITCSVGTVAAKSGGVPGTATVKVTVKYGPNTGGETLTDCATIAGQATPSCVPTPIPQLQSLVGSIYLCGSNPVSLVSGGLLSASGPQTINQTANPLDDNNVAAGTYTMDAVAPSGYNFTACGASGVSIGTPATTASQSVTVPAGGTGTGIFYVVPAPPPTQSLIGHIYLCGSNPVQEVSGGTISATGPQSVAAAANPLDQQNVAAGAYTMDATAPTGYQFTSCGGIATIDTPTTAHQTVTVPSGGTGTGVFYVAPTPPPPSQVLVGHIYLCGSNPAQEISGGHLSATGPQSVAATSNPLDVTGVAAGSYTMNATAPAGYDFTACGGSATIGTPTSATETVNVPSGGTGTGVFYVTPVSPAISLTVSKSNDANASGTYAQTETATGPGENVPFKVVVTNPASSPASVKITSISDQWPGQAPFSPSCASDLIGVVLTPGSSATCYFTVDNYSGAAGTSLTDTVSIGGCDTANGSDCTTAQATSTVVTPPASAPPAPPSAGSTPVPAAPGHLAFTGAPGHLRVMLVAGLSLLSVGLFLLWFTRPNPRLRKS